MTYAYYPGCALQHRSHAYDVSIRAVARVLNLDLIELNDWNCCGATEYFSVNQLPAYALVARNLARAVDDGFAEMAVPCSACGTSSCCSRERISRSICRRSLRSSRLRSR